MKSIETWAKLHNYEVEDLTNTIRRAFLLNRVTEKEHIEAALEIANLCDNPWRYYNLLLGHFDLDFDDRIFRMLSQKIGDDNSPYLKYAYGILTNAVLSKYRSILERQREVAEWKARTK